MNSELPTSNPEHRRQPRLSPPPIGLLVPGDPAPLCCAAMASYPGVYVEEIPGGGHPIAGVPTAITAFVGAAKKGAVNHATPIRNIGEFEQKFGGAAAGLELADAVRQFFLNGGTEAIVVRIAKSASAAQVRTGLRALDKVDLFNLLVLPGVTARDTLADAVSYCRKRRAFLIGDAPADARTPAEMEQSVLRGALPKTSDAAVYFPWIRIADPLHGGAPRTAPPSGTIAGLYARTDRTRGVWQAPAGTDATLQGVKDLACRLTDAENSLLNPRGINCLRALPKPVAWGARTLEGDDRLASDWKYVPVRRLALFLEESLDRGTRWAVFEPNAEPLWAQLRASVGAFLNGLFRAGAFQGSSPRDAFFVKCDATTTTPADLARGVVNIVVGFAPLKPAEFLILTLRQRAGQIT